MDIFFGQHNAIVEFDQQREAKCLKPLSISPLLLYLYDILMHILKCFQ